MSHVDDKQLFVRNWGKHQTYRKNRGMPPWIKVYRALLRDWDWIELTDAERGQLVSIWMLAADKDGEVPSSPRLIQKLCHLDSEPDINRLIQIGFLEWRHVGATLATNGRQHVVPEEEAEAEAEADTEEEADSADGATLPPPDGKNPESPALAAVLAKLGYRHNVVHTPKSMAMLLRWQSEGVTQEDIEVVTNLLRTRGSTQDFGPAYIDKPLREYLEAKRNGRETSWRTGRKGAAERNAEFDEYLDRELERELGRSG